LDVYCLFNRARATEIISPEDLYIAGTLLPKLGLGVDFRLLSSKVGVFVSCIFLMNLYI